MVDTKEPSVDKQQKDLLAQTYHIDGRVTAIEGQLESFGTQLNRIENSLINKPPLWNINNVMSIMAMVAAMLYGISQFVDLRLVQMKEGIDRNAHVSDRQEDRLIEMQEFQSQMHFEVGKFQTKLDDAEDRRMRNEAWVRRLDIRMVEVEKASAKAEVSRKAIGDYLENVDKHGSRRWVGAKPKGAENK